MFARHESYLLWRRRRVRHQVSPINAATLHAELAKHVRIVKDDADIALYHIGNIVCTAKFTARALSEPGVVILHDGVLNHFLLGELDRDAYVNEFVYNYGEWTVALLNSCGQSAPYRLQTVAISTIR